MREDEDELPVMKRVAPLLLDPLGVAELQGYIEELKAEIARTEAAISRKQSHRGVADSFFRR